MYSKNQPRKASKGSVQFKNTKGRLQIVFSYPVEEDGEIKRKRFYIPCQEIVFTSQKD
jgi:hypothetical protein